MSERIDEYLDGALPRDDLDAAERARIEAFEVRVDGVRQRLNASAPADMSVRVMRRINELGLEPLPAHRASALRRGLATLWAVRETQLRWRPVHALAAAATLVLALAAPWVVPRMAGGPVAAGGWAGADDARIIVQFRLHAENASAVALAGSFSDWEPLIELQETAPGVWSVLLPVRPGVHDYAFVVDGEQWVPDPLAPQVDDGFGGINSRLAVLPPGS